MYVVNTFYLSIWSFFSKKSRGENKKCAKYQQKPWREGQKSVEAKKWQLSL